MTDEKANTEQQRNARRVVLKKYRDRGVCQFGHDISSPDSMTVHRRTYRCKKCGPHHLGLCRSGRHEKVAGEQRCRACRKEREAQPFRSSGPPKLGKLPPAEVLDNAACGPETAHLFEQQNAAEGERFAAFVERAEQARAICMGCPVREACLIDAREQRRLGTYGGETFTPKSHVGVPARAA